MKARRYKEQYRLRTTIDPRTGRERREAEYTGLYYAFPPDGASPRRRAARLGAWIALYFAAALVYLRHAGVTGRCIYALVPFLLGLFPGVYAAMGLFAMVRAPRRMTVVQRENGVGRVLRSGAGCGAFSAIGAVGAAVCLSVENQWAAAWHAPLLMAVAAAAGFAAFARARRNERSLETSR